MSLLKEELLNEKYCTFYLRISPSGDVIYIKTTRKLIKIIVLCDKDGIYFRKDFARV